MLSRRFRSNFWLALGLLLSAFTAAHADDRLIVITGTGSDAQYIEDGKTKQLNVVVTVGDTVRWKNSGDRTHTATSGVNDAAGKPIFDTNNIAQDDTVTVTFDQALYDAAVKATGSKSGDSLHLAYFCAKHPALMGGILVFQPAAGVKPTKAEHR